MKKQTSFLALLMAIGFIFGCTTATTETETTETSNESAFKISLAQWSLHKSFFGDALDNGFEEFGKMLYTNPDTLLRGELHPDNFPAIAKGYGVDIIELVNTFYFSKADDMAYWETFKANCEEQGVEVGLIMCDALGNLGDASEEARNATIANHHNWVDIAAYLGAHTVRVNAAGEGTAEEVAANAVDGLKKLGEYAATKGINIVVENHGGYSSNGAWLAGVMASVNMDNVGTLPDFGNFCMERSPDGCADSYDMYKGIEELMPYAKGVSAKTHKFNEEGLEVDKDYERIMKIVTDAGFSGTIGIEYEGKDLSEDEGIKATKALIEKYI